MRKKEIIAKTLNRMISPPPLPSPFEGEGRVRGSIFRVITVLVLMIAVPAFGAKDLPKMVVWDLAPKNISADYANILTSKLVSELSNLQKYEVLSQENIRAVTGWTAEKMKLGCTDTQCLTALGQWDISKLISGNVGRIGNTYSVSLSLFDIKNTKAEKHVFETCNSENELIGLVQQALLKLLGVMETVKPPGRGPKPGEAWQEPVNGMDFVWVSKGCFEMGCGDWTSDCTDREKPVHEVCVDGFWMGKYEVTVGQFQKFVNETSYRTEAEKGDGCFVFTGKEWKKESDKNWRNPGFSQNDNHPVVCVSHNDAVEYIKWLSEKSKKRYRLPTEAEWEYAARSRGKKVKYSWGDGDPSGNVADESLKRRYPEFPWPIWTGYDDGYANTAPVGIYKPNDFGLYDMTGNVWEWCQDWYGENYYKNSPKNNPKGPDSGQYRVLRGGSWKDFRGTYVLRPGAGANLRAPEPQLRVSVGSSLRVIFYVLKFYFLNKNSLPLDKEGLQAPPPLRGEGEGGGERHLKARLYNM
jgi:formylglycine-generating enzyme required for sulfatase activity